MLGPSRTIHYSVTVACACLALSGAVGAQAPTLSPDQQRALQVLDVLAKVFPPGDVSAKASPPGDGAAKASPPSDTARDIRWLRESVATRPNASLPPAVLAGLDATLTALQRINELPPAQRRPVVDAVRADLELKAAYCRNHPDGMAGQVALNVRTWLEGTSRSESPQWQVMYINAPLAGFPGRKAAPFPQFSSPTSLVLPPGAYVIWAQDPKNAARRGPELLVRLGVAKAPTLDADLLVAPGL